MELCKGIVNGCALSGAGESSKLRRQGFQEEARCAGMLVVKSRRSGLGPPLGGLVCFPFGELPPAYR